MSIFSTAEVESIASLLDKNYGFQRPAGQTVGYSLSEDLSNQTVASSTSGEDNKQGENGAVAIPKPGGVHIPATIVDKSIGLPMPSLSKEAKAHARAQEEMEKQSYKVKGNAIWAAEEVSRIGPSGAPARVVNAKSSADVASSGRIEPEHEVLYKQHLNAEDVYLGVDFTRDGSSALSEGIVVKVKLPKADSAKEFELDVQPFAMILSTKDYYLKAHLPQKVVEKKASAKWDAHKKLLTVTLTTDNSDKEIKLAH